MSFNTYYWHGSPLDDPSLETAREEVRSWKDLAARKKAFLVLLRSAHPVAVGTALDHYDYAESSSRHGSANIFSDYAPEVLDRAREILQQAPLPAEVTGAEEDGANHASALGAMLNLALPEDSELIAKALEEQPRNPSVFEAATMAARTSLERSAVPDQRLLDALGRVVFDDASPTADRTTALRALGGARSPQAAELIIRACDIDKLEIQAHAAALLAHQDINQHRALLERLVASWPDNAPYPASDVSDMLNEART